MSTSKAAVAAVDGDAATSATGGSETHGRKFDEKELRLRVLIPDYLRSGMVVAMRARDPEVGVVAARNIQAAHMVEVVKPPPKAPVVVFVSLRSGGGRGHHVKCRLQELIGEDQVFDLSVTDPSHFVKYGLTFLEKFALHHGDDGAKYVRNNLRVMVAGGDGTIGWILQSLEELLNVREPVPPVGIIPLGTVNDLSRSFGWGGSLPRAWRSELKHFLHRASSNSVQFLDSWRIKIVIEQMEGLNLPPSFKPLEKDSIQDTDEKNKLPENPYYTGVFYNYFSIGMDAQIVHAFHDLRNRKPNLARSPISNKLIYAGYSCKQGWFCTPCVRSAVSWELKDILSLFMRKINRKKWEPIDIPPSIRAIVFLNIDSYGGGSHPWGHPKPEYLEKRKFYAACGNDGLLEIFGLKQGWHASCVMSNIISAKHIGQAAEIKVEIRGGAWKEAYMQMDGKPWKVKLPTKEEEPVVLTMEHIDVQAAMISGKRGESKHSDR